MNSTSETFLHSFPEHLCLLKLHFWPVQGLRRYYGKVFVHSFLPHTVNVVKTISSAKRIFVANTHPFQIMCSSLQFSPPSGHLTEKDWKRSKTWHHWKAITTGLDLTVKRPRERHSHRSAHQEQAPCSLGGHQQHRASLVNVVSENSSFCVTGNSIKVYSGKLMWKRWICCLNADEI